MSDIYPNSPEIICLCPTYKRPEMLANSLACFLAQDYPNKTLRILDDAGQFPPQVPPQEEDNWTLVSITERLPSVAAKYNLLRRWLVTGYPQETILVPWEDDDVYLPNHLSKIAAAYSPTYRYQLFLPTTVYSNYSTPRDGSTIEEPMGGRFHASWAFSLDLFDAVGGYPTASILDITFDQQLLRNMTNRATIRTYSLPGEATYVYRWGSSWYNGSQAGSDWETLWEKLEREPAEPMGRLEPKMDEETKAIYYSKGFCL